MPEVWATRLTLGLVKSKLDEHGLLNAAELHEIEALPGFNNDTRRPELAVLPLLRFGCFRLGLGGLSGRGGLAFRLGLCSHTGFSSLDARICAARVTPDPEKLSSGIRAVVGGEVNENPAPG